jgi:hypothetical protein
VANGNHEVTIRFRADSADAIAKVEKLADSIDRAFGKVAAKSKELNTTLGRGFLEQFDKKAGEVAKPGGSLDVLDRTVSRAADRVFPGLGNVVQTATRALGAFGLTTGGLIVGGALLSRHLKQQAEAWSALSAKITEANQSMAGTPGRMARGRDISAALARGDEMGAATLTSQGELQALAEARDKQIAAAEEANRKVREGFGALTLHKLGLISTVTQADLEMNVERSKATVEYTEKAAEVERRLGEKRTELAKRAEEEAKRVSLAWQQSELDRLRTSEDIARQLDRGRGAARIEARAAAGRATGNPLVAVETSRDSAAASLTQAFEDQIRQWDELVLKGQMLDTDFFRKRQELLDLTNQKLATLFTDTETQARTASTNIDSTLSALTEKLGPQFENLQERLRMKGLIRESAAEFSALATAFQQGDVRADEANEAIRLMTERLTAQGIKIDDIARVVPPVLSNLTSLFRSSSQAVGEMADEVGAVQTATNQLSTQPLVVVQDSWRQLTEQARGYLQVIHDINRTGVLTPRGGLAEFPNPEGAGQGRSPGVEGTAAAIADGQRRGAIP